MAIRINSSSAGTYNRITMPKGALASGDRVSASLGGNMGRNPAGNFPTTGGIGSSTKTPLPYDEYLVNQVQRNLPDLALAAASPILNPLMTAYAVNKNPQASMNFFKQIGPGVGVSVLQSNPLTAPIMSLLTAYNSTRRQYELEQGLRKNPGIGSATSEKRKEGQYSVGGRSGEFDMTNVFAEAIANGQFPDAMSVAQAEEIGILDDLIATGWTAVNGVLTPSASAGGGGGGGGESTTIGLWGKNGRKYGSGDKWVTSEKAAKSFYKRRSRNAGEQYAQEAAKAGQAQQQPSPSQYQAFGLVDFSVSAG